MNHAAVVVSSALFAVASTLGDPSASVSVRTAVAPHYPRLAVAARAVGRIRVQVKIDQAGNVFAADAIGGNSVLGQSSVDAAMRWKFETDSAPVRISIIVFTYELLTEAEDPNTEIIFRPPGEVLV